MKKGDVAREKNLLYTGKFYTNGLLQKKKMPIQGEEKVKKKKEVIEWMPYTFLPLRPSLPQQELV